MSYDISLEKEVTQVIDVYSCNITFNVANMAKESGLYDALFDPDSMLYEKAGDIIPVITEGLKELLMKPEKYKKLESPNGWGTYEQFLMFVNNYKEACIRNPDAKIIV